METAPLKSFATWARKALIREVTARIAVVLAPASPERVEQPKAVEALEKAVSAAGGGDKGKAAVADRVAYTWFNRIIALRFMDAKGYTGVGVVSPQAGVETGQPEILAEAKRGNIDAAVVGTRTRGAVTGLLNGTRRSDDAQGEAYALLLAANCRYWNRAMPFMFEREGDFTELLIPANLLADDSVPSRAVKVMTTDVCQDVEVIGWLYQFYISERKDEIVAGFKKNKKAGADEISAATQLFTPHWIVRYLLQNTLGRLWMLNRPSSHLVDQMEYYIAPVDEETEFLKIGSPEELKLIDPACGSGHMLTYAFDLLYAIYEEEGYAPSDIPGLILTNNLYGTEIDPRAGTLAAFALTMKARARQRTLFTKQVQPNICVLEPVTFSSDELDQLVTLDGNEAEENRFWLQFAHADTFGSLVRPNQELILRLREHASAREGYSLFAQDLNRRAERNLVQAEYLSRRYHVVVANPPYMGSKNMSTKLSEWIKAEYSDVKYDLFSAFIVRNTELAISGGQLGFMTPFVWMFISSYERLRGHLLSQKAVTTLIQLEYSGFDGATVPICTFTVENSPKPELQGGYIRLAEFRGSANQPPRALEAIQNQACGWFYRAKAADFKKIPGSPIAYWLPPSLLRAFQYGRQVSDVAEPRCGMNTGENARFVRDWYEVSRSRFGPGCETIVEAHETGRKWFPYNKWGLYRRWYGNQQSVVAFDRANYEVLSRQGNHLPSRSYYFRPAVSWSKISSGTPNFRLFPAGFVFDGAGMSAFVDNEVERLELLGLLNSSVARAALEALAPTLNFQSGDIAGIPAPSSGSSSVPSVVSRLVQIAKTDWDSQETSWDFCSNPLVASAGHSSGKLSAAVQVLNQEQRTVVADALLLERTNNEFFATAFGAEADINTDVMESTVSLWSNPSFRYGSDKSRQESQILGNADLIRDLLSYAVGCMFGRYSLDKPGLVLANEGDTVQEYMAQVPNPTFVPDRDNVIPIVDADWFEDDIVARFRQFLRIAFGEQHFEETLRFVTESLGVKDLRDYFVRSFYKDHVQRYKKRPIYWLFSSPKGSFNALIYMHRYTPSTVSTVLNEYLREFRAKLTASLQQQERLAAGGGTPRQQAAAQKEADRLRKVLLELEEYEHDVLYPLASLQLAIDLDDGVKANYPKFGAALKKIVGLEASDE